MCWIPTVVVDLLTFPGALGQCSPESSNKYKFYANKEATLFCAYLTISAKRSAKVETFIWKKDKQMILKIYRYLQKTSCFPLLNDLSRMPTALTFLLVIAVLGILILIDQY